MARERVRSLRNVPPLLRSKLMCFSASSRSCQVRALGHKRSQRHIEHRQEEDYVEDQEASSQAFNSWQLERERNY